MDGYMAKQAFYKVKLMRTHHGNIQLLTSSQLGSEGSLKRTESLSVYLLSSRGISFYAKLLLDSCRYSKQPSPDCTSVSSSWLFSVSSFFTCPAQHCAPRVLQGCCESPTLLPLTTGRGEEHWKLVNLVLSLVEPHGLPHLLLLFFFF